MTYTADSSAGDPALALAQAERANEQLQKHVQLLQQRCNELLAERRGIRYLVHEFHDDKGYPVRRIPAVPPEDEVRFRLALIAEEFFELIEAVYAPGHELTLAKRFVHETLYGKQGQSARVPHVDMPAFVDALTDLDYVIEGTRLTFGVDGWPVLLEVHRANMEKKSAELSAADARKTSDDATVTKAAKPAAWRPPDIEGVLKAQGWCP